MAVIPTAVGALGRAAKQWKWIWKILKSEEDSKPSRQQRW